MPRKPSSVFVIIQPQVSNGTGLIAAQAYRYVLRDGMSVEDVVAANFAQHPAGTRVFVVEDTKVDAYDVGVQLNGVDDPRLDFGEG